MKKRLISVLVAMMMLLSLWPASAFAEEYREREAAEIEVTDFAEMAAVLPSGETAPDSRGIVWIPVARMTEDITVGSGQEVTTLGKLIVSSDTTLTIEDGGVIEAEVYVEPGAVVHVEDGGELRTTMAGETAIFNEGSIMIDSGGVLVSQMGGCVNNRNGGTLTINGEFYCHGYTDDEDETHPWFTNNGGTVNGSGTVYAGQASFVNSDELLSLLRAAFPNTITVKKDHTFEVSDYAELKARIDEYQRECDEFNEEHYDDDRWIGYVTEFHLTANLTLTSGQSLDTLGIIVVPDGKTLTLESGVKLTTGLINDGTVIVKAGAELGTTQGGEDAILNYGQLTVEEGAVLRTQFGGNVNNRNGGTLTINGEFFCLGFTDNQGTTHPWFNNEGTVNGGGTVYAGRADFVDTDALLGLLTAMLAGTELNVEEAPIETGIFLRYPKYDDETDDLVKDPDGRTTPILETEPDWIETVEIFYRDANGEETTLAANDVVIEGDFFEVNDYGNGLVDIYIHLFDGGTPGTINYTMPGSDTTYSIQVSTCLPEFGYYSAPQPTEANFLFHTWVYDGTEASRTIYLVSNGNRTISNVHNVSGLDVDIQTAQDGKSAAITFVANDDGVRWADFAFDIMRGGRIDEEDRWEGVRVRDYEPKLLWNWANEEWDEEKKETVFVSSEDEMKHSIRSEKYKDWVVEFFYSDDKGQVTSVPYSALQFSGAAVAASSVQDKFVNLEFVDWGEATVSYQGVTVPISIELPDVGYYSAPNADENTYLDHWDYDDDLDTIYFVTIRDGETFENIYMYDGPDASLEIADSGKYVTVSMNEYNRMHLDLGFELVDSEGETTWEDDWDIDIFDARPQLNVYTENEKGEMELIEYPYIPGDGAGACFPALFKPEGAEQYLTSGIEVSDAGGVSLFYDEEASVWRVTVLDAGCYTLSYTGAGGTVYYTRVYGWYDRTLSSAKTLSRESIIPDGGVVEYAPGNAKTVYFVVPEDSGYVAKNLTVVEGEDKISVAKQNDRLWTVTVYTEAAGSFDAEIKAVMAYENEEYDFFQSVRFTVNSNVADFAFYAEPGADPTGALANWNYNEANKTIYLVAASGASITAAAVPDDAKDWMLATVTVSNDHRYAAITTNDVMSLGDELRIVYSGTASNGSAVENAEISIPVIDGRRFGAYPVENEDGGEYFWARDDEFITDLWTVPGDCYMQFVWENDYGYDPIPIEALRFSPEIDAYETIDKNGDVVNDSYVHMVFDDFGDYKVFYPEKGGVFNLHVELPEFAFYTGPEFDPAISYDTYMPEWDYDGTQDTAYIVGAYNAHVAFITGVEELTNTGAEFEIAADEKSIKVTLADPKEDWLRVKVNFEHRTPEQNYPGEYICVIHIDDVRPNLFYRRADYSYWDEGMEKDVFEKNPGDRSRRVLEMPPDSFEIMEVFFRDADGTETPVKASDLTVTGDFFTICDVKDSEIAFSEDEGLVQVLYKKQFDGGDPGAITYSIPGGEYSIEVKTCLPEFGYYSAPQATEANFLYYTWVYDGTDANKTVYLVSNDDNRKIANFRNESGLDVNCVPAEDGKSVAITFVANRNDVRWADFAFDIKEGDNIDEEDRWEGIRFRDYTPKLGFRWVDCYWDDELDKEVYERHEDSDMDHGFYPAPGDDWRIEFFYEEWDLETGDPKEPVALKLSDLSFEGEGEGDGKFFKATAVGDGNEFVRLEFSDFGEGTITYAAKNVSAPVVTDLPEVGFYRATEATRANFLMGEWNYDGTDATKTVYLVVKDDCDFTISEVKREWGPDVTVQTAQNGRYATVTWVSNTDNDHLELSYNRDFGDWYDENIRTGVRINDAGPKLIAYRVFVDGNEEQTERVQNDVLWESVGNHFQMRFRNVDNEQAAFIASGITSSGDGVALSYDADKQWWEVEILDEGQYVLTYTDGGNEYTITVESSYGPGMYSATTVSKENYICNDGTVEYMPGETTNKIYFLVPNGDDQTVKSIAVDEGNISVKKMGDKVCSVTVQSNAEGDFHARFTVVLIREGDPDEHNYTMDVNFIALDTPTNMHMRSDDGHHKVEVQIDAKPEKPEDTEVTVSGSVNEDTPVYVASYDDEGRFQGLVKVTGDRTVKASEVAPDSPDDSASLILFWLNRLFVPQSEDKEIELAGE